jgi:hypothetical protein
MFYPLGDLGRSPGINYGLDGVEACKANLSKKTLRGSMKT